MTAKTKNLLLILVLTLVATIATLLILRNINRLYQQEDQRAPVVVRNDVQTNQKQEPLLGGDRDEHGCIGSAGYSWCEIKNKCLRVWEEKCE